MKKTELKDKLINYFKEGEKENKSFGMEIEHFVVNQDTLRTISYEFGGVEEVLQNLEAKGWQGVKEDDKLIALKSNRADITLEPGGQLEIGIFPQKKIEEAEEVYFKFLQDLIPILEKQNYYLLTLGYQVKSKIKEISWNPKERYRIMSRYLGSKGKYAHNMMKGTAAVQVTIDYHDEVDFIRKFRVVNTLSPVISSLMDNAPFFEGEIYQKESLRTKIWDHTDTERTGIIKEAFADDFGYQKYAEYILSRRPILIKSKGKYISTTDHTNYQIFAKHDFGKEELEHILTMVFPDVRAKQFIEIRMADSLPPKYSFALVALWKGLLYNQDSLLKTYKFINKFCLSDILAAKKEIISKGIEANLADYKMIEIAEKLLKLAEAGLADDEVKYLMPLKRLVAKRITLAQKVKSNLGLEVKEAIKDNILNSLIEEVESDEEGCC